MILDGGGGYVRDFDCSTDLNSGTILDDRDGFCLYYPDEGVCFNVLEALNGRLGTRAYDYDAMIVPHYLMLLQDRFLKFLSV